MGHNWIIDVLADLKTFAQQNDLPLLAHQLEDVAVLARAEIGSTVEDAGVELRGEQAGTGRILTQVGASRRA